MALCSSKKCPGYRGVLISGLRTRLWIRLWSYTCFRADQLDCGTVLDVTITNCKLLTFRLRVIHWEGGEGGEGGGEGGGREHEIRSTFHQINLLGNVGTPTAKGMLELVQLSL